MNLARIAHTRPTPRREGRETCGPEPDRQAPGTGRVLRLLIPAAACAAGLVFQFHPMILAGFHATPGDPADSRLCNYLLEHTFLWAMGRPDHAAFWNLPIFHPALNVTAYSESFLAVAPAYWLWRLLALPADTAFQIWLMAMAALNFLGCYVLLRHELAFDPPASVLGSFIYAFGNSRTAQLHHAQLLPSIYCLLALLCLGRLVRAPTGRRALWLPAAVVCLIAQAYASYYLAWTFCFGLSLFLLCCMFDRPCREAILAIRLTWPSALLCLAALALSAPLLIHGLAVVRQAGWYPFAALEPLLPRPQSWLYMGRRSWLYFGARNLPLFTTIPAEHEQRLGLGAATTLCAAIGLWRQRQRPWVKPLVLATAALVILTTRWPHGVVLWRAVYRFVPGAGGIRGVSRAGLWLLLPAAFGLAGWSQRRHLTWPAALAVAVCVLEQGYSETTWPKLQLRAVAEHVAAAVPPACGSFYLAMRARPGDDPSAWMHQVDAVSAQIGAGVPTINGYSGHVPEGYQGLEDNVIVTAADEQRLRQGFERWTAARHLTDACFVVIPTPY